MAQKVNHNGNGHNLKLDPRNARKHSDRNKKLIRQSLAEVGAGRGVLADANGIIRAGNGIFEAWQEQGGKVKVIETDGKTLLVTKRKDLKGKDAIRAAMLDNLAADSSSYDYDAEILKAITNDDELIDTLTKENAKLLALLNQENIITDPSQEWQGMPEFKQEDRLGKSANQLIVHFETPEDKRAFGELIGQPLHETTKDIWYPEHKPQPRPMMISTKNEP